MSSAFEALGRLSDDAITELARVAVYSNQNPEQENPMSKAPKSIPANPAAPEAEPALKPVHTDGATYVTRQEGESTADVQARLDALVAEKARAGMALAGDGDGSKYVQKPSIEALIQQAALAHSDAHKQERLLEQRLREISQLHQRAQQETTERLGYLVELEMAHQQQQAQAQQQPQG